MRLSMRMFTRQAGVSPRLRQLVEDMPEGRTTIDVVMRDSEFDSIIAGRLDVIATAVEQLHEDERPSAERPRRGRVAWRRRRHVQLAARPALTRRTD